MQNNKYRVGLTLIFILFSPFLGLTEGRTETTVDHGIYATLLGMYVDQGRVDYRGFKADEKKLDQYLTILEKVDTQKLSRNERFAFYI